MANNNNSFWLRLIARLDRAKSKAQIKSDASALGKIYVNLIGKLEKAATKQQIKKDLAGMKADVKIGVKIDEKDVQRMVERAAKTASAKSKVTLDANLKIKTEKVQNDIRALGKRYSKLFNDTVATQKYNNLLDSSKLIKNADDLKTVRLQLAAFKSELKATGLAQKTFGETLKDTIKRMAELCGSTGLVMAAFSQMRQAWQEAVDLDTAYTSLLKVQDELTRGDYDAYLNRCNEAAQRLAVSQQALIDGATEFSRSGYGLSESNALSERSAILANVGEMNADDAAKAIISGVQAYDVIGGMDDVIGKADELIDKANMIGNTASISTAEIMEGVQSVGAVMADSNTDLDQFIALLAAGNRQYQDANKMSLALRTAALRIRSAKTELEEMGEDTDGMIVSVSKLADTIEGLTSINGGEGVKILEADGKTYRSIYDILLDISKVYHDMSDVDAAALLELIAGKNRSSAISAVLNNMSEAQEIYQRSLNATGSAQQEYETYLGSSEAALNRFKASMTETYQTVINGDTVTSLANAGNAVLQFAQKTGLLEGSLRGLLSLGILKFVTMLGTSFKASAVSMSNFGNALKSVDKIKDLTKGTSEYKAALNAVKASVSQLSDSQQKQIISNSALTQSERVKILQYQGLTKAQAEARLAEMGLTKQTQASTAANTAATASTFSFSAAIKGLGASIKAAFLSNPVGIAIMAISTAIGAITAGISSYNQKIEEAREKAKQLADEAATQSAEISELANKYIGLSEAVKSDDSVKQEYLDTQEQLLQKLGLEGESVDDLVQKYGSLDTAIRQVTLDSLKDAQKDLVAGVTAAEEELLNVSKDYEKAVGGENRNMISVLGTDNIESFQYLKDAGLPATVGENGGVWAMFGMDTVEGTLENYEKIQAALDVLADHYSAVELKDNEVYQALYTRASELREQVEGYRDAINDLNANLAEQQMLGALQGQALPSTKAEFEAFRDQLIQTAQASGQFIGTEEDIATAINTYLSTVSQFSSYYMEPVEQAISSMEAETTAAQEKIFNLETALENTYPKLLELANAGKLDISTLTDTDSYADLLAEVGLSAESSTDELQGFVDKIQEIADSSKALSEINVSADDFRKYVDTLKELNPAIADDEEGIQALALANLKCSKGFSDLSSNLENYVNTLENADKESVEYSDAVNNLAQDLSYITGIDFDVVDAQSFAKSAENMHLLEEAINGNNEALDQLRANAASGIYIDFDTRLNTEGLNEQVQSVIAWLQEQDPTLEARADLDDQPFMAAIAAIIQAGGDAADTLKSLFTSMGWDINWDTKKMQVPSIKGYGVTGQTGKSGENGKTHTTTIYDGSGTQVNWDYIDVPTNIRFEPNGGGSKGTIPTINAPKSSSSSKSGGSGGGGSSSGGGGGSSPVNDAADAVTDAAEVVEDAAQSAAEAAMEAFNEIKGIWDKWISDQQHNHQMTGYRKELADLQGKSLNDSSIPYGNYWKLSLAELDGLAFSYNGMANSLTAKMNESLASGAIQAGSKEHNEMQASIQQAYQSQFQAMVEYQELLAKREEDRTSIIERIADRFGKIVENLGKTVSRMWSWWNKNWAVNKQIAAVEKEREKQENVEKRYNKDLKRIGLESKYARAIKNDTLNVNKIQDGFVLERIQKYQDLYDKIRECQEAQKELYEQERELIKSKLSNIVEYFDNIQKYYDSVTGKLDSLKTVKDAAGQKQSLTDILDQYAARTDSYNNAAKAQWTYQTGIDENNTRSMGEIQKDLAVDEIYDSEYYQSIKERNDKLKQQESDYQDKLEEIAELREELANATSKKEKSRIKKEIKTAKKEAKTLKLTSGQKKTLKSTDQTLTGAQYVTGAAGMEDTYASAMYQQLLKQIGQLESKKKLSKKEQKMLQMYHDELDALNEGVLVGNVATFRTKFEQLWKLDHSGKALTKAQEQTKAALEKSLDNIKQGYLDYISALDKELSDRMVLDGQSEADLEANYKKTREDTEKSFDEEMKDLTDQSGTATVKNIQANIDKWKDWLSKGKNSKGKKLTSKQKKELENKILAAQAKLEKLAQVPVENVARASSIYDWLEKNRSKYNNNKLSKKDREKWDRLTAELNGYITKQNDAVEELEKERADALEELDNNYETQLNELEEQKNQRLAETYEWAKQAAEYAIETANSTIEMLSEYINQYKSVVELLKDVDLNTLKKYGITDLLGLDGNSDVTDLLRDQLIGGIDAASRKVQESVKKGELLKKLINAGYGGDFEEVLLANSAGLDSSYIQTLRDIAAQLVEGGYSHESWIEEWEKQLADLIGDLVSTTKEVQDFKDQLREDVLFKATDNALASVNRLKNQLSSMQSIIRDDWTTDVNGMTTYGAAKVNEYAQSWKAAQDAVGLYAQRLREIDAAQANPEEYGYASEQDWLNARNEAIQNYYAAVQEGESAAQAIYEIGKKAREAEINQLKKVVESYKAANRSKKELYEYDKQHKAAQKSVDEIKAQVEALNNVSDAASKAKKQQLLSDLKDAEDALKDLEQTHLYDLSEQSLDDFINDLEDTLNNANATIKDTFEEFTKIVEETIEAAKGVNTQWESDRLVSYFGLGDKTKILSDSSMVNPTSLIGENGSIYTPISSEQFTAGISGVNVDLKAIETHLSQMDGTAERMLAILQNELQPDVKQIINDLGYDMNITYNAPITIEGCADHATVKELTELHNRILGEFDSHIFKIVSKAGLKRKYR